MPSYVRRTLARSGPRWKAGPAGRGTRDRAIPAKLRLLMICAAVALQGCTSLLTSATDSMAKNLVTAFSDQTDPETVRAAVPAYLLLLDSLLAGSPDNASLHMAAAKLNAAYAAGLVDSAERRRDMARKAFGLAQRSWCLEFAGSCGMHKQPFEQFGKTISDWPAGQIGTLYDFGVVWAGYIQQNSGDWTAIADIPKVALIMRRVAAVDESRDGGGADLYLGIIESLVPPALGGNPARARTHFQKALALSDGRNLMVSVIYAERYARMIFDRDLHDRLLRDVLDAPAEQPGYTLTNTMAKARARQLLTSGNEYF